MDEERRRQVIETLARRLARAEKPLAMWPGDMPRTDKRNRSPHTESLHAELVAGYLSRAEIELVRKGKIPRRA